MLKPETEEKYENIFELYKKSNISMKELCYEHKASLSRFKKWRRESGIKYSRSETPLSENYNICLDIYLRTPELNLVKLCKEYGINPSKFATFVRASGEKIKRKYNFDETYFDTIDTEEKAYWLGFIAADGCVRATVKELRIGLSPKDSHHLEKLANIFNLKIKNIKQWSNQIKKYTYSSMLNICSKKIHQRLIEIGIGINKSLNLSDIVFLSIPSNLWRHFIRGYFDGDGYIYVNKKCGVEFGLVGTGVFLEKVKLILQANNILNINISKPKKTIAYVLRAYKSSQLVKLREYLYNDSTVFLERKRDKFNLVFDRTSEKKTSKFNGVSACMLM